MSRAGTRRGREADPLGTIISRQKSMRWGLLLLLTVIALRIVMHSGAIHDGWALLSTALQNAPREPVRMSADDVAASLQDPRARRPPMTDVRCLPDDNAWDYVCAYQIDPAQPWSRAKIGVLVGTTRIRQMSPPHLIGTPLPPPSGSLHPR